MDTFIISYWHGNEVRLFECKAKSITEAIYKFRKDYPFQTFIKLERIPNTNIEEKE